MRDLYHIVGNLLRIVLGHRYSIAPYAVPEPRIKSKAKYPSGQVDRIALWASDAGIPEVGQLFHDMLVREVRNAFFHSDYVLTPSTFNIRDGEGVIIDRVIEKAVPLGWLTPRLQLGINTALATLNLTVEHIHSYETNKVVQGRFTADGSLCNIELMTRPGYGLVGFRSPPASVLEPNR